MTAGNQQSPSKQCTTSSCVDTALGLMKANKSDCKVQTNVPNNKFDMKHKEL